MPPGALLSFLQPALLWGLSAALLPVLIHLLFRPRPRRVRFPAIALLQDAIVDARRAHRLQNLALLLVRAAGLATAALLLAGPTCTPPDAAAGGNGPTATVLVLDDSLSTRARLRFGQPETLLDVQRRYIAERLAAASGAAQGSEWALVTAGTAGGSWTSDAASLRQRVESAADDRLHARPLGAALDAAARLLRTTRLPARHLVIVSDGAASAWRDVPPRLLTGLEGTRVTVVWAADQLPPNLTLVAATAPDLIQAATLPTPMRVRVRSAGVATEVWVVARDGETVLQRVGPLALDAGGTLDAEVLLPPGPPGPRSATIGIEPADLLPFDQERHVAWQTGPRPEAWLVVADATDAERDVAAVVLRNLLAPELLPPEQQRLRLRVLDPPGFVGAVEARGREASNPALVVVMPGVSVSADGVEALRRWMEAGTFVLLVPDSGALLPDWPGLRGLLAEGLPEREALATDVTLRFEEAPPDEALKLAYAELARVVVRQRVRLRGLLGPVTSAARYSDGPPAVVTRRFGAGTLALLTTTPDPSWSELGIRAAGLLTWLHRLADAALGAPTAAAAFTAGEVTRRSFPTLTGSGLVEVRAPGAAGQPPAWVRLRDGTPESPWPTAAAGRYEVRRADRPESRVEYVVNWPAEEFDLTPLKPADLTQWLGEGRVNLVFLSGSERGGPERGGWQRPNPAQILGAAVAALFLLETAWSVRRGRPPAASAGTGG